MTQLLSLQTVVTANTGFLSSELSETEMVMMNIDKGFYYGLDEVGKTIWDALAAESRSVSDLCEVVLTNYLDAEREQVEQDMYLFLADLLQEELIQVSDAG